MPGKKVFLTVFYRKKKRKNTFGCVLPCWPVGFVSASLSVLFPVPSFLVTQSWLVWCEFTGGFCSVMYLCSWQTAKFNGQADDRESAVACVWCLRVPLTPFVTSVNPFTEAVLLQLHCKLLREGGSLCVSGWPCAEQMSLAGICGSIRV